MLRHWLRRHAPPPARRVAPQAEWLEPRLLFSADLGAGLLPGPLADTPGEVRTLAADGEYARAAQPQTLAQAYATTALHFEQNGGQEAAGVDFAARGNGYAIALAGGNAEIALTGASSTVRLELVGAQHAQAQGEGLLQARSNYLLGNDPANWHTGIANYSAVRYEDVYQGVDVRYYGNQRQLEYDFIVAAGADAAQIRLQFEGAEASLDADGNLVLRTPEGRELRFAAPVSYQQGANGREAVASAYEIHADGSIGFRLGAYDASRELVIDPILQYASYFGGNAADTAVDIAVGSDGYVYVTGSTHSTGGILGTLLGGLLGGTAEDIYVAKFSADLSTLVWSTRVGGAADDTAMSIAVDSAGRAVVAGTSKSTDFTTVNADDGSRTGSQDAVVFKLNATGDGFVFSTYFGDSAVEIGYGVALDAADNIYVTGLAGGGANGQEAFVNKYTATGAAVFQVMYGGTSDERGLDIAVDGSGSAIYVVGNTNSSNLPTPGGHATVRPGQGDGFLARFDGSGALVYGTYIGGDKDDTAVGVAADAAGRAYVIGRTDKAEISGFATTAGALGTTAPHDNSGYLRIYDTNLTGAASLAYSSFIGGTNGDDAPTGIALLNGRVVVTGQVGSSNAPVTADALQSANTDQGMYLAVINPLGNGAADLQYGTFYGTNVVPGGVATHGSSIYVAATTSTSGLASSGGYMTSRPGGSGDGLVVGLQWVNSAPVLGGANALPSILEDSAPGNGMLVTALLAGQVSDAEGIAGMGIAITAADNSNGSWQYSLDNGATWVAIGAPTTASALLLGADARVRFVPAANYNGTASISFRAWDRSSGAAGTSADTTPNGGSTAFSTFIGSSSIVVQPVNDAPVAAAASASGPEDTAAIAITLGGSDVDGTVSSILLQNLPAGGLLYTDAGLTTLAASGTVYAGSSLTLYFVPAPNFNGPVQFDYQVTDDLGATGAGTASITVTPVDDATVVVADGNTVAEDNAATGNVLANDSDVDNVLAVASFQVTGDATTYLAGQAANIAGVGTVTLAADGSYVFTPVANWNGVAVLSYTTNTGATATLTITVTAVDDPSNAQNDSLTIAEEGVANGNVLGNDSDVDNVLAVASFQVTGDATTYLAGQAASIAGVGTVTLAANGNYVFTPLANWNGAVPLVTYTTNTGATATLTLTVTAVDDATVVAADGNTVAEDNAATGNVLANDSDVDNVLAVASFQVAGDTTTYLAGQAASIAGVGTVTLAADGSYVFTPVANWSGATVLSYTTNTGATTTLAITVTAVDDPTAAQNDSLTVAEEGVANGNVLGNDSDADNALAVASFQVANDATVYLAGQAATLAGIGTITMAANGNYVFTPLANWNGTVPLVTYTTNTGATATLALTVTPVDDATVVVADTSTVAEDNAATGNVLANDSDIDNVLAVASFQLAGDTTTYLAGQTASIAGIGTVTLAANGSFTFTPLANWNGTAPQLTYTTNTGATATLRVTVNAVDDATNAGADGNTVAEDSAAAGNVLANDSDVDNLLAVASFRVAGDATTYLAGQSAVVAGVGTFTLAANGSYTFTPLANWNGTAPQFSYTTNTGTVATLAITVTAVNDAPVLTAGAVADLTAVEGPVATPLGLAGVSYGVGGGADESATQVLTFTITAVPDQGLGRIVLADGSTPVAAGGSYTLAQLRGMQFVAAPGVSSGTASFRFSVSDGAATLAQALDVRIVNQAPVLAGANALPALLEDARDNTGMLVADLLAGQASDPNGVRGIAVVAAASRDGEWQFSHDGGASWAALAGVSEQAAELLAADARVRFVPAADWNGTATGLVFRAWDGSGGSAAARVADTTAAGGNSPFSAATATATVVVTPVNDAPIALGREPSELAVVPDRATSLGLSGLGYAAGGGSDEAGQALTVIVTALPSPAIGTVLLADGVTVVEAGRSYTVAELQGMVFLPASGNGAGAADFSWNLRDDGGTAAGGVDQVSGTLRLQVAAGGGQVDLVAPVPPAPAPAPAAAAPAPVVPPAAPPAPAPAPAAAAEPARARESSAATAMGDAVIGTGPAGTLLAQHGELSFAAERRAIPLDSVRPALRELSERAEVVHAGFVPGADFLVTGFAQGQGGGTGAAPEDLRQALRSGGFVDELDRLREKLRQDFDLDRTVSISVAGLSLGVSVVYILWLVRGGVLVGSYLSALPAWRLLDPLPVLARAGEDEDDEEDALAAGAAPDPLRGFA